MKRNAAWALLWLALSRASGLGIFDFEGFVTGPGGDRNPTMLVLAFPDSLAGAEVRALLTAENADTTSLLLLPRGRLSSNEQFFLDGLRGFVGGSPDKASQAWGHLRFRRLDPLLQSCYQVDAGLMWCMRGETSAAESAWVKEWRRRAPASEAAWRNLLGVYLALRRFGDANDLLDVVLREQPHNRTAAIAKASLLKQLRPDSEWEAFLRTKSSPEDSLPDIQEAYGEVLVQQGRWSEAVRVLDRALEARPQDGKGWKLLAEAQYRRGYQIFALDCLENAMRSGYRESDIYELYARVLRACCMGGNEDRSAQARREAEHLLEEGLPKDLHRRSMAQLLYHVYCQNGKPEAARQLQDNLWFHFEGPSQVAPPLGYSAWPSIGLMSQRLRIDFGLYALNWILALRKSDFYQAF